MSTNKPKAEDWIHVAERTVKGLIKKGQAPARYEDELLAEGRYGLAVAIKNYNPDKLIRGFEAYLVHIVCNRVKRYLRSYVVSTYSRQQKRRATEYHFCHTSYNPRDKRSNYKFDNDWWEFATFVLTDREQEVVRHHYIDDLSFIEIAEIYGVTKQAISQCHARAIKRLREDTALVNSVA
jgi:RNA polymerase sigma factor (sigma-70 family)